GRQLRQHRLDVADRVAADLEPRLHRGWKSRPEMSFGKTTVVFAVSTPPRLACAKTSSIRVGRSRYATAASPSRTRRSASAASAVYEMPSCATPCPRWESSTPAA